MRFERRADAPDLLAGLHADLMFTLAAMLVPTLLALLPAPRSASAPVEPAARDPRPGATIVADPEGLRLLWLGGRRVPVAAVPEEAGLRAALANLRAAGTPLRVLIEPAGLESAFLLEPILAAEGPAAVTQIRATTACAAARDRWLVRLCAPAAGAQGR
jgi:hypothetical protein